MPAVALENQDADARLGVPQAQRVILRVAAGTSQSGLRGPWGSAAHQEPCVPHIKGPVENLCANHLLSEQQQPVWHCDSLLLSEQERCIGRVTWLAERMREGLVG